MKTPEQWATEVVHDWWQDGNGDLPLGPTIENAIRLACEEARREEREACARIAETWEDTAYAGHERFVPVDGKAVAGIIRARQP